MLTELTVTEALKRLRKKEITASELLDAYIKNIEEREGKVWAFLTLTEERAREEAARQDREGLDGMLAGIPMALKDNMCTRGVATTCSSKILKNYLPPYDAAVVEDLREAGALLLGKTNMDEFAMGSSTENSAFFVTHNPWDLDRVPGGSSGGSAAAVAAGEAAFALGSDTGGSIRQPAAYCGVVGFKPTYGLVSRYGLVAFASSLDQIGPLTRDVGDCALVLNSICRHDPRDSTSIPGPREDYTACLGRDVKGLKVGVPREFFEGGEGKEGIAPEVRERVRAALKVMEEDLQMEVEEVSLPHTRYALPCYYIIAPAEASSNLARYDGIRYGYRASEGEGLWENIVKTRSQGFGSEVKRRIMLGTYALSSGYYDAYYLKALKVRTLLKREFEEAFARVDVLVTPTAPTAAFKIGENTQDPLTMYLNDIYTIPVNMAGLPALSMPCGYSGEGLPVGLQLIGPPLSEGKILQVAHAYERAAGESRGPGGGTGRGLRGLPGEPGGLSGGLSGRLPGGPGGLPGGTSGGLPGGTSGGSLEGPPGRRKPGLQKGGAA